jgi:hypothetical protein
MMLRGAVLLVMILFLLGSLYAVGQDLAAWPMLLVAGLFVAGTLFERFHYRGSESVDGDWQPTAEKFLDERSGRPVTVWFNPRTGGRRYVEANDEP